MLELTPTQLSKVMVTGIFGPNASEADVKNLVNDLKKYPFAGFGADAYFLPLLVELLEDTEIDIIYPVSYPLGGTPTELKVAEVEWAVEHGADEVDVVMNISAFRSGKYDYIRREMEALVKAAKGKILKIIPCTTYLTPDEIRQVARMMKETGVTIFKTNAGYKQVTKYNDVKIAKEEVGDGLCIMPAGGVRNADITLGMVRAGADRIDSSTAKDIFNSLWTAQRTYTEEELEKIIERVDQMNKAQPKIRGKIHD